MPQCCTRTSSCGLRTVYCGGWWHCRQLSAAGCLARCCCLRSELPCGATLGCAHNVIRRRSVKLEGLYVCC